MTLSATGEADTPAGGSVCIRWLLCQSVVVCSVKRVATNLEVAHQTASSSGRHDGKLRSGGLYELWVLDLDLCGGRWIAVGLEPPLMYDAGFAGASERCCVWQSLQGPESLMEVEFD